MGDEAYSDYIEFALTRPSPPDVSDASPITPISNFGDSVWTFPKDWLPPNKPNLRINHDVNLSEHYVLLRKKVLLAELRIEGGGWGRKRQPSPTTLCGDAGVLRLAFLFFASQGYEALRDVPLSVIEEFLVDMTEGTAKKYTNIFEYINHIHERGVIDDHLSSLKASNQSHLEGTYVGLDAGDEITDSGDTYLPIPDDDLLKLIRAAGHIYQNVGPSLIQALEVTMSAEKQVTQERAKGKKYQSDEAYRDAVKHSKKRALSGLSWPILEVQSDDYPWPPTNYKGLTFWLSAAQSSVYSIVALQIGARDSEMMSIKPGSWTKARSGQWYLDDRIWKTTPSFNGTNHRVAINDDAADALNFQLGLFEAAQRAGVNPSTFFFHDGGGLYVSNRKLHELAKISGINKVHSHQFRKSLARLVALSIVGAPKILQEIFGHTDLQMTLKYIMALPDMAEELRKAVTSSRRDRAGRIYDEAEEAGGGGADRLRNVIRELQADVASNAGHNSQEKIASEARNRFITQVLRGGLGLKQVAPGVVCIKAPIQNGFCAAKGEELNAGQCQIGCPQHLELGEAKDAATDTIWWLMDELQKEEISTNLLMRKFYRRQLAEYVSAWPELKRKYIDHPVVMSALDEARKAG